GEEHDEHSRTVAGIGKAVIKSAVLATRLQIQEPGKQPALAAARTGTGQASRDRAWERGNRLGHSSNLGFRRSPRKRGPSSFTKQMRIPADPEMSGPEASRL